MAIVKVSYNLTWRGGASSARSALGYMTHRPDLEGRACERSPFSAGRDALEEREGQAIIGEAPGHFHYRMVLNPGAGADPQADLREWTREVMAELERREAHRVPWVAVVHDNHARHAHVHVVAITESRLGRGDLEALRGAANRAWEAELRFGWALQPGGVTPDRAAQRVFPEAGKNSSDAAQTHSIEAEAEQLPRRAGLSGPEVSL